MQTIDTVQVPDFTGNLTGRWQSVREEAGDSALHAGAGSEGSDKMLIDSNFMNIYSSLGENAKLSFNLVERNTNATPAVNFSYELNGQITLNTSSINFQAPVLKPLYDVLKYAVETVAAPSLTPKCVEFYTYITSGTGKFRNLSNNIILKFKLFGSDASPPVYNNFNISLMNLGQRCELPMSTPPYVKETSSSCCDTA